MTDFQLIESGDLETLYNRHKGLIHKFVLGSRHNHDDALSVANEVFMGCVKRFEPDKGYQFNTFLGNSIEYRLRTPINFAGAVVTGRKRFDLPTVELLSTTNISIPCPEKSEANDLARAIEQIDSVVAKLDAPREQATFKRYFYDGATLSEIGRELGISGTRVGQLKDAAVRRVRALVGQA